MKKLLFLGLMWVIIPAGCGRKTAPLRKTYIYCSVDTLRQRLPSYQITSNSRFPYGKFSPTEKVSNADYRDGQAVISLEIDRPTTVMVMPVCDSTVKMALSESFLLLPGDSLELLSVTDSTTFRGFASLKPALAEARYEDNRCDRLLQDAFPYKDQPKVEAGDLMRYKADVTEYYRRKREFLDSCRMRMTLSPEYLDRSEALFAIGRYNDLCFALDKNPDSEVPAGYLEEVEIPQSVAGSPAYVSALLHKYVKHAVADPTANFDAVYAGIRKAPRRLRDHLTALMIGYYAGEELPAYKPQLEAAIDRAHRTIADTVLLDYIDRAARFYARCGEALPGEVDSVKLLSYDGAREETLAEVLARFDGQPVYLDFWSSWCVGCIIDIMRSAEARAYLEEEGVAYVCLSLDEDADAWRKAADQYKVVENSYLVSGEFDSPLCTYFEIKSIPRYILLDREHRILSSDAPRPVEYSLADLRRLVERLH